MSFKSSRSSFDYYKHLSWWGWCALFARLLVGLTAVLAYAFLPLIYPAPAGFDWGFTVAMVLVLMMATSISRSPGWFSVAMLFFSTLMVCLLGLIFYDAVVWRGGEATMSTDTLAMHLLYGGGAGFILGAPTLLFLGVVVRKCTVLDERLQTNKSAI